MSMGDTSMARVTQGRVRRNGAVTDIRKTYLPFNSTARHKYQLATVR
jgi:hypothetical protein